MDQTLDFVIPIIFLVTFPLIWFLIITMLKTKAKMTRHLNVSLGQVLSKSSWGSGVINGMSARNSLRVKEYEKGHVLEIIWLLGGGKLWLPKEDTTIGELVEGSFFRPKSLQLKYKSHKVTLYGKLINVFI